MRHAAKADAPAARGRWAAGRFARRAFIFPELVDVRARLLLGALEGAMLVARYYEDPARFRSTAVPVRGDLYRSTVSSGRAAGELLRGGLESIRTRSIRLGRATNRAPATPQAIS